MASIKVDVVTIEFSLVFFFFCCVCVFKALFFFRLCFFFFCLLSFHPHSNPSTIVVSSLDFTKRSIAV